MSAPQTTIKKEWEEFAGIMFPGATVSTVQFTEMRKAFYAGFTCLLLICMRLGDDEVSEEEGCELLSALEVECRAFLTAPKGGEA